MIRILALILFLSAPLAYAGPFDAGESTGPAGFPNPAVTTVQGTPGGSAIATAPAAPSSAIALITGQVKIAVTGTAVRLTASSQILANGLIITASPNNNSTGATFGLSSVTNVIDGSGNGAFIAPGASQPAGAGVNINTIYVNGTAGDIFYYAGN